MKSSGILCARLGHLRANAIVFIIVVASIGGCGESPKGTEGRGQKAAANTYSSKQYSAHIDNMKWDGNQTLTLTVSGKPSELKDLIPIVGWGYTQVDLSNQNVFKVAMPGGGGLYVGAFCLAGLEDLREEDLLKREVTPEHYVLFAPFKDVADDAKGGILEYVPTSLEGPGEFKITLALPVYLSKGRIDWLHGRKVKPMFVLLAPSPYAKVRLHPGWRWGIEPMSGDVPK